MHTMCTEAAAMKLGGSWEEAGRMPHHVKCEAGMRTRKGAMAVVLAECAACSGLFGCELIHTT